jgi:hypothetical protein
MGQIAKIHDLNPQLGFLGVLKVSKVGNLKLHSNQLDLFLFLIVVVGFELSMKISLCMIFFAKSVVKGPVDGKKVISKVAFVADEFLVLTGRVKRL